MPEVTCPHCRGRMMAEDHLAGATVPCPHCTKPLTLPEFRAVADKTTRTKSIVPWAILAAAIGVVALFAGGIGGLILGWQTPRLTPTPERTSTPDDELFNIGAFQFSEAFGEDPDRTQSSYQNHEIMLNGCLVSHWGKNARGEHVVLIAAEKPFTIRLFLTPDQYTALGPLAKGMALRVRAQFVAEDENVLDFVVVAVRSVGSGVSDTVR